MGQYQNPYRRFRPTGLPTDPVGVDPEAVMVDQPMVPSQPRTAPPPVNTRPSLTTDSMSEAERYFQGMQAARANRPMTERYQGLLEKEPKQEDYRPSKWRAAGSILSGAAAGYHEGPTSGMRAVEDFQSQPYRVAQERYGRELESARTGAEIEQGDINQQMGIMRDAAGLGLDYSKFRETQRKNTADIETDQQKLVLEELKAFMPDYERVNLADGGIQLINRKDASDTFVIKTNGTVESGNLAVNRGNLGVNQENAATNRFTAQTGRARQIMDQQQGDYKLQQEDIRLQQLQDELTLRTQKAQSASPDDQREATIQALREMSSDPTFAKYVQFNEQTGDMYLVKESIPPEAYEDVRGEIEDRVNDILERAGVPAFNRPRTSAPPTDERILRDRGSNAGPYPYGPEMGPAPGRNYSR